MAIINPAIENNNYNCSLSEWYFDSESIISFDNGLTKYSKEVINGGVTGIQWDLGSHTLITPNNYSYGFVRERLCKEYYIIANITTYGLQGACYPRSTMNSNNIQIRTPYNERKPEIISYRWTKTGTVCPAYGNFPSLDTFNLYITFKAYNSNCSSWVIKENVCHDIYFQIYNVRGVSNFIGLNNVPTIGAIYVSPVDGINSPNFQIRIFDNNQFYYYPISDINSIQLIYSQSGFKYKFYLDNNLLIEKLVSIEKTVILKCGKDCPPDTCLKCRNINYVCCYNSQGIVTEIINDPNYEIEAC